MNNPVPVIMYHSVGISNDQWIFNYLTCPYRTFEDHLVWLRKRNFRSITLQQLFNHMKFNEEIPDKPIIITFDDNFADIWVYAYPLLKKFGFKGVIYVNPEFVDPRKIIRKNLDDVWNGETALEELTGSGYLSWDEMRLMEKEGAIEIQSHSMTHTWYPVNNTIIDFRHPGDPFIWMTWNEHLTAKPFLQTDNEHYVQWGQPVYQNERSIGALRFFPDKELDAYLIDYVKRRGGKDFFGNGNWRSELFEAAENYLKHYQLHQHPETDAEHEERLYYELKKSKEIIEDKLNKQVPFLCWPGGVTSESAIRIVRQVGYISSTAGKDLRDQRKKMLNMYGEDASRINRTGPSLYWNSKEGKESRIKYFGGFFLLLSIWKFEKRPVYSSLAKIFIFLTYFFYSIVFFVQSEILKND